jgi:two-component system NarL family response regulator
MSERGPIEVLVVDDHPVFRRGLVALIASDPALRVAGEAGDGAQALEAFRRLRPAVVLMDLRMPGTGGIEAVAAIVAEAPAARIVVLSSYEGDEDIRRALGAGARAYLLKDTPGEEVLKAIHAVHAGRRYLTPAVAERLAEALPQAPLSSRELDVLRLLARGLPNRAIAGELAIEENTVKVHVRSILSKLGVDQRTEAAVVALQRGIIHLD